MAAMGIVFWRLYTSRLVAGNGASLKTAFSYPVSPSAQILAGALLSLTLSKRGVKRGGLNPIRDTDL